MKRISGPAAEPLDRETEAKAHLRVDIDDDNTFIDGLIAAAREYVEMYTRRALITQTWRLNLECWPTENEIRLPRPPLQSVTSLKYFDEEGTETTWNSSNYLVDTDAEPGRIVLANNVSWPSVTLQSLNPIQIEYVAGYGADESAVPQYLKQALLLIIGHWYENREATIVGTIIKELPLAVRSLLWMDRVF